MTLDDEHTRGFFNSVSMASEAILDSARKDELIHVYSHLDADGIAAAGIIAKALNRLDARFRIRITQWLDEKSLDEIIAEKPHTVIFTDLGTEYVAQLRRKAPEIKVIALDHHQVEERPAEVSDGSIYVNPHLFSIDGSRDISGSGVVYFVAKSMDPVNVDLAPIAIVGALGDLQDKYDQRMLGGLNRKIVDDAVDAGLLTVEKDLIFFGRETRPIHKALASTTSPYIPEISGAEDKSLAFLASLGIKPKEDDKWRALRDLSEDEKKKLCSALANHMLARGLHYEISNLIGHVYTLTREEPWTPTRDGREFAVLLNAAGRMGKPGLGIAICTGDRGSALEDAISILEEYRWTINKYLGWITEKPERLKELENIYLVYGEDFIDEKIIGAVSSILSTNLPNPEKPLIAYAKAKDGEILKFSARTTDAVASRGVNLGKIMQIAAGKCLGKGGGHDVAAGAQVPVENVDAFIKLVNELVGKALAGETF
ncbi:MAG: DHH family phosphoesterase [Nitrososphaerota archaeon]|nr:DHH family phosphoesterase [Candidatus Bathyarchaeota archaeon]MDW8193764.1 DHH family phosphoesterase [Nitrososphaerota archaeon]